MPELSSSRQSYENLSFNGTWSGQTSVSFIGNLLL